MDIEKDWEGRPSLVYITYSGIEDDWLGECGDKTVQCIICVGLYKLKNHKYKIYFT